MLSGMLHVVNTASAPAGLVALILGIEAKYFSITSEF